MSKEQIVQIFRIAVAAAAGKIDDATDAFRGILADSDVSAIDVHSVKDVFLEPVPQWRGSVAATMAAVKAQTQAREQAQAQAQEQAQAHAEDEEDYSDMPPLISIHEARGYPPAQRSTVLYDAGARMVELNRASLFPTTTEGSGSDQNIDLVITETSVDNDRHTATSAAGTPITAAAAAVTLPVEPAEAVAFELGDDENNVEGEADEEVDVDEEADAEDEEADAEDEEDEEEEAEDDEVETEDEAVELNLEPVRIKKVIYWKDTDSGDLYAYLPEDEVGDKVGAYVNGKPVFD